MTMKKQLLIILALVMVFAGCRKKVNLKAEWEKLEANTEVAYEAAETPVEKEAVVTNMLDSVYLLLNENMGAPYSDTLFMSVYYMLSPEQCQELFSKMPKEMLESEDIAELHKKFLLVMATAKGNPYTDIISMTPSGDELALSDLVGKTDYVLVDFWASWCGPCRRLIPVLKEIYAGQPAGKLQILGCSVDRDEAAWLKALEEEQMAWPQIRDGREGQYNCAEKYGVSAIPTTILIDREGNIIARNPDEAELETILFN